MTFNFFIYDIAWPSGTGLPDEATIQLPEALVDAQDLEEVEWHDAINDDLQRQFGERAVSFQMAGDTE